MIVIMTSCAHCHTIIHIQSYNHTHTSIHIQSCNDVAHGYMKHSHEKLCCTYPWSLRLHRCSSADWLLDLWSLRLPPVQFTGVMEGSLVSAPATCSLPNRLSNLLPLRVRPGSWPGRFLKCWCLHLPPLEFRGLIVRSLASAPATRAVYQSDRLQSLVCFAAPATWQFTRLIFKMMGVLRLPSVEFSGLIVGSLVCLPPVQFNESDGWIKLHACSLRLPPLQLAELIFKLLVFAPALGAVYQVNFEKCCCVLLCAPATGAVKRIDCQIPGLCACQLCSLPEWWLDPWSWHLPPVQYQIASQVLRLLPLHWVHATFVVAFL